MTLTHSETEALVELIEDFRDEIEAEMPLKLHQDSGESAADFLSDAARKTNGHPATWTGLPFTPQFERYLGHSENYGYEFIAAASFDEIAAYCRSHHDESHAVGGPTASMCRRFSVAVVELRQPLAFVAAMEGTGIFAVRKLLLDVLGHAAQWRERKRNHVVALDEESDSFSLEQHLRRQHDEAREQRVWNLMRLRHPYLPDWDYERGRRLEQHIKLGCPECMTAVA